MARIDADALLPNDHVKQMALDGDITQIHRGTPYADEGDTFDVEDATFEVVDVTRRTLGDLTDEDAQAEGSENLDAYRARLERAHSDGFEWDDDAEVVRHRFERRE